MEFKVRDKRITKRYFKDNTFLNGYAKAVGWPGQCVYDALCRHADKDQRCFPSHRHLAIELGISAGSVNKGIKKLEKFKIISIKRSCKKGGGRAVNIYDLLDTTEWREYPGLRWSNRPKEKKADS